MSKYQKVNIVESKFPPSNKYDWWYDLNENVLKRFVGDNWTSIASPDPGPEIIVPEELKEPVITIQLQDPGAARVTANAAYGCSIAFPEDYWGYRAVVSAPLEYIKNPIDNMISFNVDYNEGPLITAIYIPNDTSILPSNFITGNDSFMPINIESIIIGTGVQEIATGAFVFGSEYEELKCTSLYIYASEPPALDAKAFMIQNEFGDSQVLELSHLTVYVPAAYYLKYKKATNWAMCNIQKIEDYDN